MSYQRSFTFSNSQENPGVSGQNLRYRMQSLTVFKHTLQKKRSEKTKIRLISLPR